MLPALLLLLHAAAAVAAAAAAAAAAASGGARADAARLDGRWGAASARTHREARASRDSLVSSQHHLVLKEHLLR